MNWLIAHVVGLFLLPPLNLLVLAAIGGTLASRRPRLGKALVMVGLVGLWLLSTPLVARHLLAALETAPALALENPAEAQAIVILGGGSRFLAPEYGGDTLSGVTLERIRYGALLHRRTGKPILVSGGNPVRGQTAEAGQMRRVLREDFGIPVRWVEDASHDTLENARLSQKMLASHGIGSVYLVTHAWHMPRAKKVFEQAGLKVVPAPTAFTTAPPRFGILSLLPRASALEDSSRFFHEALGLLWYRIRE